VGVSIDCLYARKENEIEGAMAPVKAVASTTAEFQAAFLQFYFACIDSSAALRFVLLPDNFVFLAGAPKAEIYFMGLIDILTHYDTRKKAAHAMKTAKHGVSCAG